MSLKSVLRRRLANVRARGLPNSTHLGPVCFILCGALLICGRNAAAAPPFSVVAPTILTTTVVADTMSTNCTAYNTRVSISGVPAPVGVNHAGDCGFSSMQLVIDGQPAAQYWQQVSSGAIQAPYRTTFSSSPSSRHGFCAVADKLRVQLSVQMQPTVLSWPQAAVIGGACALETSRHDPLPVISQSAPAATSTLRAMAAYFNNAVANHSRFEVCLDEPRTPHAQAIAAAKLAKTVATDMEDLLAAPRVRSQQAKWNRGVGVANNCALRCNQCASGWAGTITNNEQVIAVAGGDFVHNELDTYYVGGTQTANGNVITVPADWIATGGGTNLLGGKRWTLSAAAAGACPGSNQNVCVEIVTDSTTGVRLFTELNVRVIIDGALLLTQGAASFTSAVDENQFKPPVTMIQAQRGDNFSQSPMNGQVYVAPSADDCALPPEHSGMLQCTQTWTWHLFLQN